MRSAENVQQERKEGILLQNVMNTFQLGKKIRALETWLHTSPDLFDRYHQEICGKGTCQSMTKVLQVQWQMGTDPWSRGETWSQIPDQGPVPICHCTWFEVPWSRTCAHCHCTWSQVPWSRTCVHFRSYSVPKRSGSSLYQMLHACYIRGSQGQSVWLLVCDNTPKSFIRP